MKTSKKVNLFFVTSIFIISSLNCLANQAKIFSSNRLKLIYDIDYCQSKNAQCGRLIKENSSEVVLCPSCPSGESCVSNRCEPKCKSSQFDLPVDNLLLHMPMLINEDDLSELANEINTKYYDSEGFQSNTDFTSKQINISLSTITSLPDKISLAFKIIPREATKQKTILNAKIFSIIDKQDVIAFKTKGTVKDSNGKIRKYLLNINKKDLKTTSCNHIAWVLNKSGFDLFINGKKYSKLVQPDDSLDILPKSITIGRYSGKIWALRLYSRDLQENEVNNLAISCLEGPSTSPYQNGYPNFLCGAYVCLWWPLDSDLDDGEQPIPLSQYQYYLKKQDEMFERHVLDAGMYPALDICGFMNWSKTQTNRNLILDSGIRKKFVKPYSESKPVRQYWLHENFHSFQGGLSRYTNGEKRGKKFLLESTASWGADSIAAGTPQAKDSLLGMYTLVPHLPLWTNQSSPINDSIYSRFQGGHQYGAFIFFSYVTRYILNHHFIGDMFNDSRARSQPIAAANDILAKAGYNLKEIYADFAAKTINYDYLYTSTYTDSEIASCERMYKGDFDYNKETCIVDSPKIATYFDDRGTHSEWREPPSQFKLGSWAYNAYEVNSPLSNHFEISVAIDSNNPSYAEFQARLVMHDLTNNSYQYYAFPAMRSGDEQTMALTTTDNSKFYLVVASTPDKYGDFEIYNYQYKIKNLELSQDDITEQHLQEKK